MAAGDLDPRVGRRAHHRIVERRRRHDADATHVEPGGDEAALDGRREARAARAHVLAQCDHGAALVLEHRAERASDGLGDLVEELGLVQAADVVLAEDVRRDHEPSFRLRYASVNSSSLPSSTACASPTFTSVRWSLTIVYGWST